MVVIVKATRPNMIASGTPCRNVIAPSVPSSLAAILMVSAIAVGINQFAPASWVPTGQSNVVQTVDDLVLNNMKAKAVQNAVAEAENSAAGGSELSQAQIGTVVASVQSAEEPLPMLFFLDSRYVLAPFT